MKDDFSVQASAYLQFRLHYSTRVIAYLIDFVGNRSEALDVATGNGQVANQLVSYSDKVYATDISENQLQNAFLSWHVNDENVTFPLLLRIGKLK